MFHLACVFCALPENGRKWRKIEVATGQASGLSVPATYSHGGESQTGAYNITDIPGR